MLFGILLPVVWIIFMFQETSTHTQGLRIECAHLLRPNSFDVAPFLTDNTNFTIQNAFAVSVFVNSPCCSNITILSEGDRCSKCSLNGMKICQLSDETLQIRQIQSQTCRGHSYVKITCEAQVCMLRTGQDQPPLYKPGDVTQCVDGSRDVCLRNGLWVSQNCNQTETKSLQTQSVTMATVRNVPDSTNTTQTFPMTTVSTSDDNNTFIDSDSDNKTELFTTVTHIVTTSMNGSSAFFNETIDNSDADNKAMRDLYTFLIVLGVVLVLVFILVCGFFIRKQKDKVSITHVDFPLEYWQDKDYIDNVMKKSYTSNSAFTVNPVYSSDDPTYSKPRYKKRVDTEKERRSRSYDGTDRSSGSICTKACESTARDESNVSMKTNEPHEDKYIATAAGSHFYNYSPTQSQDVTKATNLDEASSEDEAHGAHRLTMETFTGKHSKTEKKHRTGFRQVDQSRDNWKNDNAQLDGEHDLYGLNHKGRLKRSLDYWSAEESDV